MPHPLQGSFHFFRMRHWAKTFVPAETPRDFTPCLAETEVVHLQERRDPFFKKINSKYKAEDLKKMVSAELLDEVKALVGGK